MSAPVLSIEDLVARFHTSHGVVTAVDGISLDLQEGEILGVLGETGSGKSVLAWSILGLLPSPGRIERGRVLLRGMDMLAMPQEKACEVRGKQIGLIVQNARAHLNPLIRVGEQIGQAYRSHGGSKKEASEVAIRMLERVAMPDPAQRAIAYPHELSGGMAQRVLIAMAIVNEPSVLIADEPTMGLDVTIQAQILELFADQVRRLGASTLLITRDLAIVAQYCHRVAILHAGRIIEVASVERFFMSPQHPYSVKLVKSASFESQDSLAPAYEGESK